MTREEIIKKAREYAAELTDRRSQFEKLGDLSLKKLEDLPNVRFRNAAEVSFLDDKDYPYITIVLDSESGDLLSGRQIPVQKPKEQT
jgi:hypothetical protein